MPIASSACPPPGAKPSRSTRARAPRCGRAASSSCWPASTPTSASPDLSNTAESTMNSDELGGIIHVYQKYDPVNVPGPSTPPPDLVSPAFEHLLYYGNTRRLTPEELARMVKLDPSQIKSFGPSL